MRSRCHSGHACERCGTPPQRSPASGSEQIVPAEPEPAAERVQLIAILTVPSRVHASGLRRGLKGRSSRLRCRPDLTWRYLPHPRCLHADKQLLTTHGQQAALHGGSLLRRFERVRTPHEMPRETNPRSSFNTILAICCWAVRSNPFHLHNITCVHDTDRYLAPDCLTAGPFDPTDSAPNTRQHTDKRFTPELPGVIKRGQLTRCALPDALFNASYSTTAFI